MGIKQQKAYCEQCGQVTTHVTTYHADDSTETKLVAVVRCRDNAKHAA
jgi:hypothetical protein